MAEDFCPLPDFSKQERVKELLKAPKKIAIVGMSPRPERPSNEVGIYFRDAGWDVYPVHPTAEIIDGMKVYASVKELPEKMDIVDIFVAAKRQGDIVEQTVENGAPVIWFQPGAENPVFEDLAEKAGLEVHSGTCTMAEHRRFKLLKLI